MKAKPSTHVLVVDDQSGFRELLKRFLEPAGYEVRTAADAHEALASIADSPPAVAILDVHMPGPNGLWLANQIRAGSPKTAIVLATSDDTVPPIESLKKGVVAYIVKPLQRAAVLTAVSDAFRWFAKESRLDVWSLGVPLDVVAEPDEVEAGVHDGSAHEMPPPTSDRRVWISALVVVTILTGAAAALYRQRTPARAFDLAAAASGAVTVEDPSGKQLTQGSGFFVGADIFVTNHHVINGGTRAKIAMAASRAVFHVTGLLAFDRQHDLALLRTSTPATSHLTLSDALPALGEDIFVYGAPRGLAGTLSQGIVSAIRMEHDLLQISAPISPGSSGSPVVNADGAVVGVVAGYRSDGQSLNFAIPAAHVRHLLSNAGGVRPLAAAARGAGNDLERNELIGPVKIATVFGSEPYLVVRDRLRADYARSMPAATAAARAEQTARTTSKTILLFDQQGRLAEQRLGDEITRTLYEYDERGRLKRQVDLEGDRMVTRWDFVSSSRNIVEAVIEDPGAPIRRRVEYGDDGRLISDEVSRAERVVTSTRWTYADVPWPTPARKDATSREEHDALGNLTHRITSEGTETRFEYTFDARGNWLSRETIHVAASGTRNVVRRERREIQYW